MTSGGSNGSKDVLCGSIDSTTAERRPIDSNESEEMPTPLNDLLPRMTSDGKLDPTDRKKTVAVIRGRRCLREMSSHHNTAVFLSSGYTLLYLRRLRSLNLASRTTVDRISKLASRLSSTSTTASTPPAVMICRTEEQQTRMVSLLATSWPEGDDAPRCVRVMCSLLSQTL